MSAEFKFYQLNLRAQTGKPHPNISTTFIGRSRPLEEAWRQIPRSAAPVKGNYSFNYNTEQDFWLKYMSFSKHITCKNKSLCKKCYVHVRVYKYFIKSKYSKLLNIQSTNIYVAVFVFKYGIHYQATWDNPPIPAKVNRTSLFSIGDSVSHFCKILFAALFL